MKVRLNSPYLAVEDTVTLQTAAKLYIDYMIKKRALKQWVPIIQATFTATLRGTYATSNSIEAVRIIRQVARHHLTGEKL